MVRHADKQHLTTLIYLFRHFFTTYNCNNTIVCCSRSKKDTYYALYLIRKPDLFADGLDSLNSVNNEDVKLPVVTPVTYR